MRETKSAISSRDSIQCLKEMKKYWRRKKYGRWWNVIEGIKDFPRRKRESHRWRGKLRRNKSSKRKEKASKVDRKKSWNGIPPFVFLVMGLKKKSPLFWQKYRWTTLMCRNPWASGDVFFMNATRARWQRRHLRYEGVGERNFLSLVRNRSSAIICAIFNARRGYFESIEVPTFRHGFSLRWIAQIYLLRLMSPFKRNERD